jgi:NADH dehydrogenase [ubiquinone] 1 alpha subcomplex assembly factor 1
MKYSLDNKVLMFGDTICWLYRRRTNMHPTQWPQARCIHLNCHQRPQQSFGSFSSSPCFSSFSPNWYSQWIRYPNKRLFLCLSSIVTPTSTGTLVTQGGGFTSVRARRDADLSDATGLELLVRGSGRQFEIEVDDGLLYFGRSVSRRTSFPSAAEWTLIRVPFSSLQSSIFGQRVNVAPINLSRIVVVGIYIADGQDGDFSLEIDHIRAYTD